MSILFKRGTANKRTTNTSVLDKGLPFFETDTNKLYMGDGATALKSLKPIVESSNNEFTGDNVFRGSSSFFNSAYFDSEATFSVVANATFGVKGTGYYLYQTDVTTNNTAQLILGGTTEDSTTTSYKVGTIVNKLATLTLPTTTGTVALTNDIDVTAAGNNTFTGTNIFSNILLTDFSYIIAPGRYGKYCKLLIGGNGTSHSSDLIYSLPETSSTSITLAAKNIDNNFTGTQTFAVPYNFSTNDRQGIVILHVAQDSGLVDETYYKIGYSVSSNDTSTYYMPSLCLHTSTGSTSKEIVYTLSASRATGTYDIATLSDITTKLSSLFTYSNNVLTINI